MRRFWVPVCSVIVAGGIYTTSAFRAAWDIREAMRAADTATLERRVDWPSVRQSLKSSAVEARTLISEMSAASGEMLPKPTLWQRIKAAAAPFVADPLIDRYVTAEGAPQLWKLRQTWRQTIRPALLSEPASMLAGTALSGSLVDRILSVASRLERVSFATPTRLELELRDRLVEHRVWMGALELRDFTWVLTEVHILRKQAKPEAATDAAAPGPASQAGKS